MMQMKEPRHKLKDSKWARLKLTVSRISVQNMTGWPTWLADFFLTQTVQTHHPEHLILFNRHFGSAVSKVLSHYVSGSRFESYHLWNSLHWKGFCCKYMSFSTIHCICISQLVSLQVVEEAGVVLGVVVLGEGWCQTPSLARSDVQLWFSLALKWLHLIKDGNCTFQKRVNCWEWLMQMVACIHVYFLSYKTRLFPLSKTAQKSRSVY